MFAAADAEAAYRVACEWLPGFEDANHDGRGDRTRMFAVGIHQIEDVLREVRELYGVDVGGYDQVAVDPAGVPRVRAKAELAIFLHPRE